MAELTGPGLMRLAAVLSPSFPTGGFAFSHGLERAVDDGMVRDAGGLRAWLEALLGHGSGWNDAVLFAGAWRGEPEAEELGTALCGSRERFIESTLQGGAFVAAADARHPGETRAAARDDVPGPPYPVAVGRFCREQGIPLEPALLLYLQAWASNLVQAALRLLPLGQTRAVQTVFALEPMILSAAARAATSSLDDLGSSTFMAEMAAMRHETQYSRMFRS